MELRAEVTLTSTEEQEEGNCAPLSCTEPLCLLPASSPAPSGECLPYFMLLAVGCLLVLLASLGLTWTLCPSVLGNQHSSPHYPLLSSQP